MAFFWLQNVLLSPNVTTEKYEVKCEITERIVRLQSCLNNASQNRNGIKKEKRKICQQKNKKNTVFKHHMNKIATKHALASHARLGVNLLKNSSGRTLDWNDDLLREVPTTISVVVAQTEQTRQTFEMASNDLL